MFHFTNKHNTGGTTSAAPVLNPLTLAANTVVENTAPNTVISGILGKTTGSTIVLTDNAGGRFNTIGTNLVTGTTNIDYESGTSYSITIQETLPYTGGTVSRSTTFIINVTNVFEQPNLGTLSFSSTVFTSTVPASGSIVGATAGSTISGTLPSGLTINSAARTWAWDGTGAIGTGTIVLSEALTDASNTPNPSSINYTIQAPTTITTPVLTQTSSAGSAPFTFDAVFNTSDTFAGYTLHVQTSQGSLTPTKDGTGAYTSGTLQNILHTLTESEITSGSVDISSDGFLTWSGAGSLHVRIERDDGVTSAWSNDLADTISSSVAQWTATNGVKKNSAIGTPTNGNLTFQGTLTEGAYQAIAATIAGASKSQWELKLGTLATDANRTIAFGRYNAVPDISTGSYRPGVNDANGYAVQVTPGGTSLDIFFNNASNLIATVTLGSAVALNDVFTDELDISGAAGTHVLKIYRNGTLVATASGKTLTGFSTAWAAIQSNEIMTGNFGGQTFSHTLSSGFSIYG